MILLFLLLLCPLRWVRVATHSYECVQYFGVSRQGYGCQCLGFLTYAQMLMHAIAQGGCMDTLRKSALEVDSRTKIPCRTGDSIPSQYFAWLFSRTLYQLSSPRPIVVKADSKRLAEWPSEGKCALTRDTCDCLLSKASVPPEEGQFPNEPGPRPSLTAPCILWQ